MQRHIDLYWDKKDNDIQRSVPLYSKTIVQYKIPCFEGHIVLNISDVAL